MRFFTKRRSGLMAPLAALCIGMLVSQPLFAAKGDVNGDGDITEDDSRMVMEYEVGSRQLSAQEFTDADVDEDGDADSVDALLIAKVAQGLYDDFTTDTDGDGDPDIFDDDDDGDGWFDQYDDFPFDPDEWADNDGDGYGDNYEDFDDDNDGAPDPLDDLPEDPFETEDCDLDGVGNNLDIDDDNDGIPDLQDRVVINGRVFDTSCDTDNDGFDNPYDIDDDNDGFTDVREISHPNLAGGGPAPDELDPDGDGLDTIQELDLHTDYLDYDSDDDGYSDGEENACPAADPLDGTKPENPADCGFTSAPIKPMAAAGFEDTPPPAAGFAKAAMASSSGFESATPDLCTGTFAYSYQLDVPPGRAGLEPNVTLAYRSSSPNSWVGYGWSYDPGHIERDTKFGVPNYDDYDAFIYVTTESRTELVNTKNSFEYGMQDPWTKSTRTKTLVREFHPKIESEFTVFYFYDDPNNVDPEYWVVATKTGSRMFLGVDDASRLKGPASAGYTPSQWYLNRVIDLNGNYADFSYAKSTGEIYLSEINYTGNANKPFYPQHKVTFETELRPDRWESYRTGTLVQTRKRLKRVEIGIQGQPVRAYQLDYDLSASTGRSLLSSVTTIGYEGGSPVSLPPMAFNYSQSDPLDWVEDGGWMLPPEFSDPDQFKAVQLTDINGDGFTDIVYADSVANVAKTWINRQYENANGWEPMDDSWDLPVAIIADDDQANGVQLIDINNDGRADLVHAREGKPRKTWINNFSRDPDTGGSWNLATSYNLPTDLIVNVNTAKFDSGLRFADLNGDGYLDLLHARNGARQAWLNDHINQQWVQAGAWAPPDDFCATGEWSTANVPHYRDLGLRALDINSDGLTDLVKKYGDQVGCWVNNSEGFIEDQECKPGSLKRRNFTSPGRS